MGWFAAWLGYGLTKEVTKAVFGERPSAANGPVRQQTEEEILADEKRYDEEAKRLDEEDAARKRGHE